MKQYLNRYVLVVLLIYGSLQGLSAESPPPEEVPANDLYGYASWQSHYVNPFARYGSSHIPFGYVISWDEYAMPFSGQHPVSSHYGYRSSFQRMHYGTDIAMPIGTPVLSGASGMVRYVGYEKSGYGHYVIIRHYNGVETVYGHLSRCLVHRGQVVSCGERIALSGNSGHSTGPHLHYEMRFLGIPFDAELVINFTTHTFNRRTFAFTQDLYKRYASKRVSKGVYLRTKRCPIDGTVEEAAEEMNVALELLCQLNGVTPDLKVQKGRLFRVF